VTIVKVPGLALAVLALTVAACSSPQAVPPTTEMYGLPIPTIRVGHLVPTQRFPAVDLSATPAGWVPVAFGDAQISVPEPSEPPRYPERFIVLYGGTSDQACSYGKVKGTLFVGSRLPRSGCSGTVVAMDEVPDGAYNAGNYKSIIASGLTVLVIPKGSGVITYYALALFVQVSARTPGGTNTAHSHSLPA
jgi:hypothetical protein